MVEDWDQLDKVLDDALASYGAASAVEGLEQRVLARVTKSTRRTNTRWPLLLATSAALVAVVVSWLWWPTRSPQTKTSPQAATTVLTARTVSPAWTSPIRKPSSMNSTRARQIRKELSAPRLPQFPAPTPITSEEQALIHLVGSGAKYIPAELTNFGGPVQPIQITALEMKPLRLGWGTQEKTCCDQ